MLPQTREPRRRGTGAEISPYQFAKKVEQVLDAVRPAACSPSDGGDLEIVDIKDTVVYCRFAGACSGLRRLAAGPSS